VAFDRPPVLSPGGGEGHKGRAAVTPAPGLGLLAGSSTDKHMATVGFSDEVNRAEFRNGFVGHRPKTD